MNKTRILLGLTAAIPIAAIAVYIANPFGVPSHDPRGRVLGFLPYTMMGEAMSPTLPPGTRVVICTSGDIRSNPAIDDIVAFWPPDLREAPYVMRIVARAQDVVKFGDGVLRVNGAPALVPGLTAPDNQEASTEHLTDLTVPDGHVFVAGDNREHSRDSRYFGPVPTTDIIGRMCGHVATDQ